jgi:hypothetical protein
MNIEQLPESTHKDQSAAFESLEVPGADISGGNESRTRDRIATHDEPWQATVIG